MPELPEVETIRAGLAPVVIGRQITGVEVRHPRAVRRNDGGPRELQVALLGAQIREVARRGKFLWLVLTEPSGSERALVIHLGMSGQLRIGPRLDHPHLRVVIGLDDGTTVGFTDQRTFGHLQVAPLAPTADGAPGGWGTDLPAVPAPVAHIARDLLDPCLDHDRLLGAIRSKRTGMKRVLLDQGVVSGIGNIYADESLWQATMHYAQPADHTQPARIRAVLTQAGQVMRAALAQGGTSFDALYVNVNGEGGYFERSLAVYGRAGQPCRRCGTPIIRQAFMNRSSYLCPRCQPTPRRPRW